MKCEFAFQVRLRTELTAVAGQQIYFLSVLKNLVKSAACENRSVYPAPPSGYSHYNCKDYRFVPQKVDTFIYGLIGNRHHRSCNKQISSAEDSFGLLENIIINKAKRINNKS